jgi:hypothetical protein
MENLLRATKTLIVFDIDEVIVDKNEHPHIYLHQESLMKMVKKTHYICATSTNGQNQLEIINGDDPFDLYDVVVCSKTKTKVDMIKEIITQLGLNNDHFVQYYCKSKESIGKINETQCMTAFVVKDDIGLSFDDIKHLL